MFEDYIKESRRLQEKYKDKIQLLVGMETEYIREDSIDIIKMLEQKYSLDYLVGSVHHVNGIPIDFSLELYKKAENTLGGTEEVICRYYDHQYEIMQGLKPEVIGHFDVIRLYTAEFELTDLVWERVVRNINYAISYGALFEVSTAGVSERKGKHPYPARRILQVRKSTHAVWTLLAWDQRFSFSAKEEPRSSDKRAVKWWGEKREKTSGSGGHESHYYATIGVN